MIGKRAKVGWLVSRRGFRRERDRERVRGRAWREGERMLSARREGANRDEKISRRSSLYPRDLKPNGGGGGSLKKTDLQPVAVARSHLKIPLDIERISEKEGDTPSPSICVRYPMPCKYKGPDIKWKKVAARRRE